MNQAELVQWRLSKHETAILCQSTPAACHLLSPMVVCLCRLTNGDRESLENCSYSLASLSPLPASNTLCSRAPVRELCQPRSRSGAAVEFALLCCARRPQHLALAAPLRDPRQISVSKAEQPTCCVRDVETATQGLSASVASIAQRSAARDRVSQDRAG